MVKSKKIFLGIVSFLIIIAIIAIIKKVKELSSLSAPKAYPVVIDTSSIKKGELKSYQKFLGEFRPDNDALVSSKINATVMYISNEGTKVKKNDVIFKLDSKDIESNLAALYFSQKALQSELDSAKAQIIASNTQFINAQHNYERYKNLYKQNVISKVQLEDMENSYKQSAANKQSALSKYEDLQNNIKSLSSQISALQDNLSYAIYRAPFDGVVAKKYVNIGDTALTGKPIVEVTGLGKYLVYVNVPIDIASKIKKGDIEAIYYDGKTYDVKVADVLSSAENNLSTVKLELPNNPFSLPAHTFVDVYIYDGVCAGYIVPANALFKKSNIYCIVGIRKSKAYIIPVNLKVKTPTQACVSGNFNGIKEVAVGDESELLRIYSNQTIVEAKRGN